ncbi:MAG TPA: 3-isopropylmalate dehydratase small subunit [Isosphaeraceae bacterium]
MEPFVKHRGRVALLDWSDVNTDLIIPARYLKRVERTGYGAALFADKRYVPGGAPAIEDTDKHGDLAPHFPLNASAARGASILLAGHNFGCGSSREHAVWAVAQAGFRAVVAPGKDVGFADIFEGNAYQCGLLPLELPREDWQALADAVRQHSGVEATIDLEGLTLTIHAPAGDRSIAIEVPENHRRRLLEGLDAIGETLRRDAEIAAHESQRSPWLVPATA